MELSVRAARSLRVLALALGLLGISSASLITIGAGAATTSASLYRCRVRSLSIARPPPAPHPSEKAAAALSTATQGDHLEPMCQGGEVPQPTASAALPKGLPPAQPATTVSDRRSQRMASNRRDGSAQRHRSHENPSATSSRENIDGYWYSWAQGYQRYAKGKHVTGFWALQSNEQPYIDYTHGATAAHSLGQLWAIERHGESCLSDVEIGWTVSSAQYNDDQPHLFMYAWDCSVGLGYVGQSSVPWVQYSSVIAPNSVVSHNDGWHLYGVRLYNGNWWFYYDGQWVGYIPSSAWTRFFPSTVTEGAAGGEVARPEYATCTDMGSGGRAGANRYAAMFNEVRYEYGGTKASARLNSYYSDAQYTTGNWYQGQPGPQFRYGGPGWCGP